MIYLAADHGGFNLKEAIKQVLDEVGMEYVDAGAHKLDPEDDYPDFAIPAVEKVSEDPENNKAILACRSGVGETIVANKFPGVRGCVSWEVQHAIKSKQDDNTNVLALPADYISIEKALDIVGAWLDTDFSNEERHIRRLEKVAEILK